MHVQAVTHFIFILLLLSVQATAQAVKIPEVTFEYSSIFNSTCADITNRPIEAAAVTELENRIEEFRTQWRKDAPQLFGATIQLTKAPFEFRETKAALSLCFGFPSVSLPLTVNVRAYMRSLHGDKAAPLTKFSATLFHEVLHRYVNDRVKRSFPGKTTPLLEKYRDEPLAVRTHLHVVAIMKEAYFKVGREKDLEDDSAGPVRRSGAAIKRAQEIVHDEGSDKFVSEIRKVRRILKPGNKAVVPKRSYTKSPNRGDGGMKK